MEKSWNNQYIDLIKSKPDYIVCSDSDQLDDSCIDILREKTARYQSVFCEIGSGSGEHLILKASKDPTSLYVGLEIRFKRIYRTAEKAELLGLKNLLVVRQNAKEIDRLFVDNTLNGVYINFPDPWSGKRRWEKHRLLDEDYLNTLEKLLRPSGFFSYKTDHRERFLQICDIIKKIEKFRVKIITHDLLTSEFYTGNPESEFERLFIKNGQAINFLYSEKV